jgi:hypothetical protein
MGASETNNISLKLGPTSTTPRMKLLVKLPITIITQASSEKSFILMQPTMGVGTYSKYHNELNILW